MSSQSIRNKGIVAAPLSTFDHYKTMLRSRSEPPGYSYTRDPAWWRAMSEHFHGHPNNVPLPPMATRASVPRCLECGRLSVQGNPRCGICTVIEAGEWEAREAVFMDEEGEMILELLFGAGEESGR